MLKRISALAALTTATAAIGLTMTAPAASAAEPDLPLYPFSLGSDTHTPLGAQMQAGPDIFGNFRAQVVVGVDNTLGNHHDAPRNQTFSAFGFSPAPGKFGYAICSHSVSVGFQFSCLDVENDSISAGARIVLRPFDATVSQAWTVLTPHHEAPRAKVLRNVGSGQVIDTLNQGVGKSLRQRPYVNRPFSFSNPQEWYIDRVFD
ncbi:hypothetical protein EEZ25_27520 [Micromonospora aurantiaca]|uniref:RICIN domain-containing protein n=1 Tax=Micromonospora aurantiaca (nom. illeg.) TaxID=47850 RepID=UPI000F3B2D73|nr:RICIN domain-containing protein [Micromonospora aurantiaca]RNH98192.1 hypothetical protein EEZ25_27520 [Micromonospora aurantiaca]